MKIKNYLFGFIAICAVGFSVPAIALHNYNHAANYVENTIKMAKQGDAEAQFWLGHFSKGGVDGVDKNYVTAVYWFRKSAEQGYAWAQCSLGQMYEEEGKGVFQDYKIAMQWYRKAAKQGVCQWFLANSYRDGEGVPKDNIRSYMWYSLDSLTDGDTKYVDHIAKKMTSTEIEQAKKLARTCLNSDYQNCGL